MVLSLIFLVSPLGYAFQDDDLLMSKPMNEDSSEHLLDSDAIPTKTRSVR